MLKGLRFCFEEREKEKREPRGNIRKYLMLFEFQNACFRDIQFCPWFFTHRVEEMLVVGARVGGRGVRRRGCGGCLPSGPCFFLCISNIALGLGEKGVAGGILFHTVATSPCGNLD